VTEGPKEIKRRPLRSNRKCMIDSAGQESMQEKEVRRVQWLPRWMYRQHDMKCQSRTRGGDEARLVLSDVDWK
jgi:hypothetical protein